MTLNNGKAEKGIEKGKCKIRKIYLLKNRNMENVKIEENTEYNTQHLRNQKYSHLTQQPTDTL